MNPLWSTARALKRLARQGIDYLNLPRAAKRERLTDLRGLPTADSGIERVLTEALTWLGRCQDFSSTHDGGAARHFSLSDGWGPSYPETTGYIVPTLLDAAHRFESEAAVLRGRARRMLDWLVKIQMPCGGFQGGTIVEQPVVPVTFNTGQILMGLAAGVREFGDAYLEAMHRAATWLVDTQDTDGCWRKHATPFAAPGEKAYETHVSWGLLDAARVGGDGRYADAALANVNWALTKQTANGWFEDCCLEKPSEPVSHTIGYVLRGVVEAYRFAQLPEHLAAARRTADGLLSAVDRDGRLPGRLDRHWHGTVSWVCLTGSVQIASCLLLLYQAVGDERYRDAALRLNRFVRRTVRIDGPDETRGGVKGSFPVQGEYGQYQYLNWACKFLIDAQFHELAIEDNAKAQTVEASHVV